MIEIKNITKKFGDFTAIENIKFTVEESSIYGLVGYNGAGKTTLLKTCAGIYKPDGGAVYINDENVYDNGKIRADLFYVPDDLYFPSRATLNKMRKFYKGYYPNFSDSVYDKMVNAMGLDPNKNISSFSKGMQRQAEVILAMASRPKYMLLDEVFDGIDPQKRNFCKNLFIEYMAETGCSMILSSHNLQEVSDLCDHVALINGKKLTMDVSVDDISAAYRKYRMVFRENVDKSIFSGIENKGITVDGKMATIIVKSDFDDSRLNALNPVHIDSVNLSLEEVFLNEMEDKDYDITQIFSE
ncbi:MAG: ABC transporter ATP-binding protein [Eubacteriales bacterium]|nr:ABC transporter ATP-binding protein [Eubacteriales bacterium]